jgi:hypothetical protein
LYRTTIEEKFTRSIPWNATEDFDQASHFHAFTSQSLDVIAEHSESGDDDANLDLYFFNIVV